MSKAPVALIILDGFACRDEVSGNAVKAANKPNFERKSSSKWSKLGTALFILFHLDF